MRNTGTESRQIAVRERQVVVDERVALHVRVWPGGDGPPFLLVHGLASNCRTWNGVATRLHELGHAVAAVDQRGHGLSDKPDEGYDFPTLCRDQLRVMDALGFDRPVVAGQSFGGNVMLELAHRAPERVARMAGVDGGLIELSRQFPRWDDCAAAMAPPPLAGTPAADVEEWLRREHPEWPDDGIAATMGNFEVLPDGTLRPWLGRNLHMRLLRALWEHRPSKLVNDLHVPVLFAFADSDDGFAEARRRMAAGVEGLAHVRVEWFSPGDHDLHVQYPGQLAELLHEGS